MEAVAPVGREDDDLDVATADLGAQPPGQRGIRVQRHVTAAHEDDALHAAALADRHPGLERSPEARRWGGREPEVRQVCRELAGALDEVEAGGADGEVAPVPGERQERGLGEAGIGATVGETDVAADDAQRRDVDDPAVDHRDVGALGEQSRRGVARLGRVEDDGARCEVVRAEHAVRRGREEDDEVGIRDG